MAQTIKFLRKTAVVANYAAALAAAKAQNLEYGVPAVIKFTDGDATKLAFFIGLGGGNVFEAGEYNDLQAVKASLNALVARVGSNEGLTTTAKDTLVAAINEVKAEVAAAVAGGVNNVVAGAGIEVSTPADASTTRKVAAKVATSEPNNILVVDEAKGLFATVSMTYDKATGKLTLTGSNNHKDEVNLVIPSVVKSGRYDSTTNSLILVLNDDSEVTIPAQGLIDEWYVADTETLQLIREEVTDDAQHRSIKLTGKVKVSAESGNQLVAKSDGLFVAAFDASALTNRVAALETTVGNAESGIVKDVADLKTKDTELAAADAQLQRNIDAANTAIANEADRANKAEKAILGEETDTADKATVYGAKAAAKAASDAAAAADAKATQEIADRKAAITTVEGKITAEKERAEGVEATKVDKVEGKSLVDDAEITKLAGVQAGATKNSAGAGIEISPEGVINVVTIDGGEF